eukprot:11584834-Ditylum_brightwellii.AAC.1
MDDNDDDSDGSDGESGINSNVEIDDDDDDGDDDDGGGDSDDSDDVSGTSIAASPAPQNEDCDFSSLEDLVKHLSILTNTSSYMKSTMPKQPATRNMIHVWWQNK